MKKGVNAVRNTEFMREWAGGMLFTFSPNGGRRNYFFRLFFIFIFPLPVFRTVEQCGRADVREPASGALGPYAQLKGARVFSAMTRLQSQRLIQVILFR